MIDDYRMNCLFFLFLLGYNIQQIINLHFDLFARDKGIFYFIYFLMHMHKVYTCAEEECIKIYYYICC